jgi:16S rRNA (guanine966-N2)-methyltransferase
MRVIAGTYRSRLLVAPSGLATRPTSDRLRETLFNILAGRVDGARFADLYSGSGAVGIEALSRGARHVSFAEKATAAVAAIRANLASLNIRQGFHIETRGVSAALRQGSGPSISMPWDLVFLDPPYKAASARADTLMTLGQQAAVLLAPNALVVVEHQAGRGAEDLAERYGALARYRIVERGDAALSFYAVSPAEAP